MKFIDLFSGLGGFHLALTDQGHKCVYSCEIEDSLRDLYKKNFNIYPDGDITKIDVKKFQVMTFYVLVFLVSLFQRLVIVKDLTMKLQDRCFFICLRSSKSIIQNLFF